MPAPSRTHSIGLITHLLFCKRGRNRAAGEGGRASLLQVRCHSTGGNAHMQGNANSSLLGPWDSESTIAELAFGRPPFPLPRSLHSLSQATHQHGMDAHPNPPAVNPPQHGASHHTCFIHIPFPNTQTKPHPQTSP